MRHLSARLTALATTSALATLGLLGCASTPAPVPTSRTHTEAPVFASDEEALAAATSAYAAYLATSDAVGNDGGADPDRYEDVATGGALADALKSAEQFRQAGAKSIGLTSFTVYKMQSWESAGRQSAVATMYVCDDVSAVAVQGRDGNSMVAPDRPDRTPFEIQVAIERDAQNRLQSKTVWKGSNFC
jgi:hypothetical protein